MSTTTQKTKKNIELEYRVLHLFFVCYCPNAPHGSGGAPTSSSSHGTHGPMIYHVYMLIENILPNLVCVEMRNYHHQMDEHVRMVQ